MEKTWIEIDINKIKDNYALIKKKANGALICPVIKDNAYGHGAITLGRIYEELGANYLAVSNIKEALELRQAKIKTPILILGFTPIDRIKELEENDITQCIFSLAYAKEINSLNIKLKCHLKIDSGMNRLGFKDIEEIKEAIKLDNLDFEGIFTHFSDVDDNTFSEKQFDCFKNIIDELEKEGIRFKIRHCANSGSLFNYPEYNLDMVRPGIVLYGLGGYDGLKQVLELKSIISHIKEIKEGEYVGYNRLFKAINKIKVATIPIGYGDGYLRINSGKNVVYINNKPAKILGNICMDQMMVDISDIDCKLYDEVLIYGDLEKIAKNIGTISYELICTLNARVPIYYKNL